mgnify:CR=1 FL=1
MYVRFLRFQIYTEAKGIQILDVSSTVDEGILIMLLFGRKLALIRLSSQMDIVLTSIVNVLP